MRYSVVIPVYNEARNVQPLYRAIAEVMDDLGDYEILFVDDGSTDTTFEEIRSLHEEDGRVRCVSFRRNFGKTPAVMAGFAHASGDIVITMDGDLQNDPRDIPGMVDMLDRYDVVCGWRHDRKDKWLSKKLPSRISNAVSRRLTGLDLHDFNCGLKVYRREALDDLLLYGEMHRYIPAVVAWKGYRVGEKKIRHHEREHGRSKYDANRLLRGFFDLVNFKFWADYSTRPLHFFGGIGSLFFGAGFLVNLYLLLLKLLYGEELSERPLLLLGILLMIMGLQVIFFGFLAEIMIREYYTLSDTKMYSVRETL